MDRPGPPVASQAPPIGVVSTPTGFSLRPGPIKIAYSERPGADVDIAFFQTSLDEASAVRSERIRRYVRSLPDADFDPANKEQLCALIAAQFRFPDMPEFAAGEIERGDAVFKQGSNSASITVYFPYAGEVSMFALHAGSYPLPVPSFELGEGVLIKTYQLEKRRLEAIDSLVDAEIQRVQQYLQPVRQRVPKYNEQLLAVAREAYDIRANELNENKQAVAKLSGSRLVLRRRSDGAEGVIVPVHRKRLEVAPSGPAADPVREFVLGLTEYDDILKTISSMVQVMERTPSVFAPMDEEPLRTILLVALNGIYEGQASAETFNGQGKTDILIRHDDRNVFIAECLMWKGPAYLLKKMDDQLFRYAMWRDSKLALIIFNRGGDFTHTIAAMKSTLKSHPQCVNQQVEWRHESGARYLFRRHDDSSRHFLVTAIAFDVPSGI